MRHADTWTFGPTDSDKAVALLQGSRGGKVRCRFTLLYPAGGMSSGGTGELPESTPETSIHAELRRLILTAEPF